MKVTIHVPLYTKETEYGNTCLTVPLCCTLNVVYFCLGQIKIVKYNMYSAYDKK